MSADKFVRKFPLQQVLELACAAQRVNKEYVKIDGVVIDRTGSDADFTESDFKYANRTLMCIALGTITVTAETTPRPTLLCTTLADQELANDIQKFFRRLVFNVIGGADEFTTEINALLSSGEVPTNKFGFIACLPSMYRREYAKVQFEKKMESLEDSYLGNVDTVLLDKDCEIIECNRSKNYAAFNISAIIDNKVASWMSSGELKLGPCVVIKAKVKGHNTHWKYNKSVTRLNYVKAFQ